MMNDLEELTDDLLLDDINMLGHSMGGKLSMKFAQTYPELINKLVVADIGPKKYPVHHQQIIKGLESVPMDRVKSRQEVKSFLEPYINEEQTIQFFLKNLYWREKGKLDWRFNLEGIAKNIDYVGEDLLQNNFDGSTLFIRGGNSSYILDSDIPEITSAFPNSEIATIPNAGHWLHAENPKMFFEEVDRFLMD